MSKNIINDWDSYFPKFLLGIALIGLVYVPIYIYQTLNFWPLVALPLAVVLFFSRSVTEIDGANRRYREAFKLFNIIKGKWIDIPDFLYISVVGQKIAMSSAGGSILKGAGTLDTLYGEFHIKIFVSNRKKLLIASFDTKEPALERGIEIAKILDSRCLNATIRPPEFITSLEDIAIEE